MGSIDTVTIRINLHIFARHNASCSTINLIWAPLGRIAARQSLAIGLPCLWGVLDFCLGPRDVGEGSTQTRVLSEIVFERWSARWVERCQVLGGLDSSFLVGHQRANRPGDGGTKREGPLRPKRTMRAQNCGTESRLVFCCCGSWFGEERSRLSPTTQPFWIRAPLPSGLQFLFSPPRRETTTHATWLRVAWVRKS